MFFVYVLKSLKDSTTYIGYTQNLEKRLQQHNNGETRSLKKKDSVRNCLRGGI